MVHTIPHKARCPECGYEGLIYPGTRGEKTLADGESVMLDEQRSAQSCPACARRRLLEVLGPLPELEDLGPDPEGGVHTVPC